MSAFGENEEVLIVRTSSLPLLSVTEFGQEDREIDDLLAAVEATRHDQEEEWQIAGDHRSKPIRPPTTKVRIETLVVLSALMPNPRRIDIPA